MNNQFAGWLGENATAWGLSQGLDPRCYWRIDDLIIPDGMGGTSQIDHAIVSQFGIFVIEVKNRDGLILGTADQATWRQICNGRCYEFQNPLVQNDSHIRALLRLLNFPKSFFHSIIFFCGRTRLAGPVPFNVRIEGVTTVVHSRRQILLWPDEVNHAWRRLWDCKNNPELSSVRHVQNVNALLTKRRSFIYAKGLARIARSLSPNRSNSVKHEKVNKNQSTIIRPELHGSGKPIDLQPYFRAVGMPHSVTISLMLAVRWGWHEGLPDHDEPRIIAWATRLVLSGDLLFRSFQTEHGEARLATVSDSDRPEARDIELCILIGKEGKLHLIATEELQVPTSEDSRQT